MGSVALQTVVGAFASYLAWMWMLGHYPATKISAFVFLTPLFALLFGMLWLGEAVTLFETTAAGPYFFNFHRADLGNFTVIGPSGSGKTVVLNFLLAQARRFNPRIIFFDKDRGAELFIRAIGGQYDRLRPDAPSGLNPLQLDDTPANRQFLIEWMTLLAGGASSAELDQIRDAIETSFAQPPARRRLRYLVELFRGGARPEHDDLHARLRPWWGEGERAWLFDNERDLTDLAADTVGFDMTAILDDPTCRTPAMFYFFHRVEQRLDGSPAIIVIDEGWKALDDEIFVRRIKDWEKTIRKRNGVVGFATQSASDALESKIASAIIEQAATQIFMANPKARAADYVDGFGLTPQDVETALRQQNVEIPAGRVEGTDREFTVLSETDLRTAEQFGEVILGNSGGYLVRLKDVAKVELGSQEDRFRARFNGVDAVPLGVVKQAVANPLEISEALKAMLPQIQRTLPEGVKVAIAYDSTIFIEKSIEEVYKTVGEAVLLVILVIFLFLRSWRATLIPLVTIPVSLVGAFAIMWMFGFTINTLTLLAMVLAIGLVVDDAIVMLENIYRHIEEGLDPFSAAIKGAREIGFAIVAMTLTLVAVYAPLAFTPGRTGRLFVEFALALAGAVVVSGFVALTLSPMMCSLLLRHNPKPHWFDRSMERWLTALSDGYGRLLRWLVTARWTGGGLRGAVLQARWLVLGVMALSGAALVLVYPTMRQELSPLEDRGTILASVTAPDGATLEYTNRYALELEKIGRDYPEFDRIFANIGNPTVAQGSVFLRATPWEERERSTLEIARELQPKIGALPGITASVASFSAYMLEKKLAKAKTDQENVKQ